MNTIIDQMANIDSLENLSTTIPGMNDMEPRSPKNLLSSLLSEGGISTNINIVSNYIDGATADVSKKLDTALK